MIEGVKEIAEKKYGPEGASKKIFSMQKDVKKDVNCKH